MATRRQATTAPGLDITEAFESYALALTARNKSPRTIQHYRDAMTRLRDHLITTGRPTSVSEITRADINTFLVDQLARLSPGSAASRFRGLRPFFRWLVAEGEIVVSPMDGMSPPAQPVTIERMLSDDELRRLDATVEKLTDLAGRRDHAIIRTLIATGMRRSELTALTVDSIDLRRRQATVMGKGARERTVSLGNKAAYAIDRYLRLRVRDPRARATNALWLGERGPLSDSGIAQMIERRADQAGLGHVTLHMFRRSVTSLWIRTGGDEGSLMLLMGWSSREMITRYGRYDEAQRALEVAARLNIGDTI